LLSLRGCCSVRDVFPALDFVLRHAKLKIGGYLGVKIGFGGILLRLKCEKIKN
jgi:hypothetical protein